MQTKIISGPHFVTEALFGIGLSYGLMSGIDDVMSIRYTEAYERLEKIARGLAHKPGGGHNKFLETITLTLDVRAPRYWWQEFDTYRVGVTKQSESTMHTITKRPLSEDDFEMPNMPQKVLDILDSLRGDYLRAEKRGDKEKCEDVFHKIKALLPEGFLQRRIVCLNAKALQNMYTQRRAHRLPEWHQFFDDIITQLPEDSKYGEFVGICIFGGPEA